MTELTVTTRKKHLQLLFTRLPQACSNLQVGPLKVVSGKVVVEGHPFQDGAKVMVIAREGDETFELSPQEEAEIIGAVAEADRGELIDASELIKSLGKPS